MLQAKWSHSQTNPNNEEVVVAGLNYSIPYVEQRL